MSAKEQCGKPQRCIFLLKTTTQRYFTHSRVWQWRPLQRWSVWSPLTHIAFVIFSYTNNILPTDWKKPLIWEMKSSCRCDFSYKLTHEANLLLNETPVISIEGRRLTDTRTQFRPFSAVYWHLVPGPGIETRVLHVDEFSLACTLIADCYSPVELKLEKKVHFPM